MSASATTPPIRQPLQGPIVQAEPRPLGSRARGINGRGFQVEADIVEDLDAFERRLRAGRYDLAINGLQFAGAVQTLEQQRRRAEAASLEADGKVQALIEACPLSIISLDLDGNVKLWSRGAGQIFGWREEEVLGTKLPTIPQAQEQEYLELLEAQFSGTSPCTGGSSSAAKGRQFCRSESLEGPAP